jgi:hypothetical protein
MSDGFKGTWADEDDEPKREPYTYWGIVTNNNDPEKRGRVKANIVGFSQSESTWIEQVGAPGGGGNSRGMWAIPQEGSTILVGFILGDIDSPYYLPGPWPTDLAPGNNDPKNLVWQTEDFRFSFIEQDGNKRARLETLVPNIPTASADSVRSIIEINVTGGTQGKSHVINITAPSGINLTSQGTINIDAPVVMIKGRTITPSDEAL